MHLTRRHFAATGLATIAFAGLARSASPQSGATYRNEVPGYGELVTDPAGLFDLPPGFRYRVISSAGEAMDDGFVVPDKFDGMGAFPLDANRVALVRNHELKPEDAKLGPAGGIARLETRLRRERFYGADDKGAVLPGGTTTVVYDFRSGRREAQYLSLVGTAVNCAGGPTPWGSWLTCEETELKPGGGVKRAHGWVFEVPSRHRGLVRPVPIKGMGRFRHEAAAVDPRTGIVYLTEDQGDGLFYRFIPRDLSRLSAGGKLQALALRDGTRDTRNWGSRTMTPGEWKEAVWRDLKGVDSPADDLRNRAHQAGAALFARGEGIHRGNNEYYFTCTSGGTGKIGQIMRYVPSPREGRPEEKDQPGRLQLFIEPNDDKLMNYVDNITVAQNGHLIACEDRSGDNVINHLKGITPEGRIYTLARLNQDTELAGTCFSADGSTMFVNVYRPGKTLAVTGPWGAFRA